VAGFFTSCLSPPFVVSYAMKPTFSLRNNGTSVAICFQMSTDPLVQELYRKKMAPPHTGYYSRGTGLHKVLTEPFILHTEAIHVYNDIEATFTDQAICDLTEILIFPTHKCYPFIPRSSPLKELLTYGYVTVYSLLIQLDQIPSL